MSEVTVRVVGLDQVVRSLARFRDELDDLPLGEVVGDPMVERARPLVPVASGALVATVRAAPAGRNRVRVSAGSPAVPYAAVQNYGWPARNITGRRFLDEDDPAHERAAVEAVETYVESVARRLGLT